MSRSRGIPFFSTRSTCNSSACTYTLRLTEFCRKVLTFLLKFFQGSPLQKQYLKIKKFWGESENAVRIQIYASITTYCMMAIVQKKMRIKRSIYKMLQIASISLTDTTVLKDLFEIPNHNIVKERNGSEEPTLFDCLTFN